MRFEFMKGLYDLTGGARTASVAADKVAQELGWAEGDADQVVDYLVGEGLIELVAFGPEVSITHRGIREVEAALEHPDRGTEHFAPINVINVGKMYGSQIQQGTSGSSQSPIVASEKTAELTELIAELRAVIAHLELAEEDRSEIEAELDTADRQLKSSRPKSRAIKESLARSGEILADAANIAGGAARVIELVEKVHRTLPGL